MRLREKVALVTGGGSGIGRATSTLFAGEGAKVVVADSVVDGARETVQTIKENGGEAISVQGDVSQAADAERMVQETVNTYGKLDVLFNNAGYNVYGSVHELSEQDWDKLMSVNLKGVFLVSKYAVKHMMKTGGGSIVNNASSFGIIAYPRDPVYCASKGGIISLTRQMALDYASYNIRVNCICPGPTLTPRIERAIKAAPDPEERRKQSIKNVLLGRFAKPEEIAYPVLFLASDEASFITGIALQADGGQTIH
ncbi:MAG: glucose 1-dehydrogenase [Thaumarchaeota archaeon]|nr:glucose 1-dehydrogenase [Nitrososphaerota archaeon]